MPETHPSSGNQFITKSWPLQSWRSPGKRMSKGKKTALTEDLEKLRSLTWWVQQFTLFDQGSSSKRSKRPLTRQKSKGLCHTRYNTYWNGVLKGNYLQLSGDNHPGTSSNCIGRSLLQSQQQDCTGLKPLRLTVVKSSLDYRVLLPKFCPESPCSHRAEQKPVHKTTTGHDLEEFSPPKKYKMSTIYEMEI